MKRTFWSAQGVCATFSSKPLNPRGVAAETQARYGEVGLNNSGKVRWKFGSELADRLALINVTDNWTEARLEDWLDRNISHLDLEADETNVFINWLITEWQKQGLELGPIVRERFPLRRMVEKRIDACRGEAQAHAFQDVLFDNVIGAVKVSADQVFTFDTDRYPARWLCERSDEFKKHYHRDIGELSDHGEEFACAQYLNQLPEVEYWIRNLERQPDRSFWLPTATDRFYPDFVCKLTHGQILVVEYKGKHLWSNDYSKEKRQLGELWMRRSSGTCVFVMPEGLDLIAIKKALSN